MLEKQKYQGFWHILCTSLNGKEHRYFLPSNPCSGSGSWPLHYRCYSGQRAIISVTSFANTTTSMQKRHEPPAPSLRLIFIQNTSELRTLGASKIYVIFFQREGKIRRLGKPVIQDQNDCQKGMHQNVMTDNKLDHGVCCKTANWTDKCKFCLARYFFTTNSKKKEIWLNYNI